MSSFDQVCQLDAVPIMLPNHWQYLLVIGNTGVNYMCKFENDAIVRQLY